MISYTQIMYSTLLLFGVASLTMLILHWSFYMIPPILFISFITIQVGKELYDDMKHNGVNPF